MPDGAVVPSPAATGDAGGNFELHVDAFSLALLLAGAVPPILTNTSVAEIRLQTRHSGWKTDDLLIIGKKNTGMTRKLAVQVKRNFSVSASNADCCKTMQGFWDDFQASDRFNESEDRLAIVTQHGTSVLLNSFNSVLTCAQASGDANDFFHRVGLDRYISKKAKQQNKIIRLILENHIGNPLGDDDYWRFLRVVNILSYDLNTSTAQTEAAALSLLAHVTTGVADAVGTAKNTWAKLLECASRGRPTSATYRREDLPEEIVALHSAVPNSDTREIETLRVHGTFIRENIRTVIGDDHEIDRSDRLNAVLGELEEHQIVIITGAAGSGKSALAMRLLSQIEVNRPVLAFQAVEFATAHIDQTLVNAQTKMTGQSLRAILAGHDCIVILIESVERLLEHSVKDAFSHLLRIAQKDHAVKLVLTCRGYSAETVRNSLLEPLRLRYFVHEVPELTDEELQQVQVSVPGLDTPLQDIQLRSFLRTPYLLDTASRLDWMEEVRPKNVRAFRKKCWKELIRDEQFTARSMPGRREKAFVDVACRRATELRQYVQLESPDNEALDALTQASLIKRAPDCSTLVAPAHDVLEDWAIIRWLDGQFSSADCPATVLADFVGGFPALRRGYRRWLGERFDLDPDGTRNFVLGVLDRTDLPAHFRDDCLVAALFSETVGDFLDECLKKTEGNDTRILIRIIHMLRVACKSSPQRIDMPDFMSQMSVPTGPGWVPVLRMVRKSIETMLPAQSTLILGFVEDWAMQVDWNNPLPAGFEEAGCIVEALLSFFDDSGINEARKRTLKLLLKIPRTVPRFKELVALAETSELSDRKARDFTDLVFDGVSGSYACRDYPAEVISLANARLMLSEDEFERRYRQHRYRRYAPEVSELFGIRECIVSEFFPASARRGPFAALLRSHPKEGLDFILDFLNHAGEWYSTRKYSGKSLEPASEITLDVPGAGPVQQWVNGRFYGMYRGMTVGPCILQSALMALEAWLLNSATKKGECLETQLLDILRKSNNVMATSVVASVCVAFPVESGRAGLALLSNRDIVELDRDRSVAEVCGVHQMLLPTNQLDFIFVQERVQSNGLEHRQRHLEFLAYLMQMFGHPALRNEVWRIIDHHRTALPDKPDRVTLSWRMTLDRMDVRNWTPVEVQDSMSGESSEYVGKQIHFNLKEIDPEVKCMVDKIKESSNTAMISKYMALNERAKDVWNGKSYQEPTDWRGLLNEARLIERETGEPKEFCRGGPGFAAAVCVRDHIEDLGDEELNWCVRRIEREIHRSANNPDVPIRMGGGDMQRPEQACASVVPLLAAHEYRNAKALLASALTHPVGEISLSAYSGLGKYLGEPQKDLVIQCAAAACYQGRLLPELRNQEAAHPGFGRTRKPHLNDRLTREVRDAIESGSLDFQNELASLDFNDMASSGAIRNILETFGHHPNWEEARLLFRRITEWLAAVWIRDDQSHFAESQRHYELEPYVLQATAQFALKLPANLARNLCRPLIDGVETNAGEVEEFLDHLIVAAAVNSDDCFWDLWQDLADKAVSAPWVGGLNRDRPSERRFIGRLFLNSSWKDNAEHWNRLAGNAYRIDTLARRLPASGTCLEAYAAFLYNIGRKSLPESFKVVAWLLKQGAGVSITSNSNMTFYLESLLLRFVYSEPHRLKKHRELREAVLEILEVLVSAGSSSAYRMRDDFVTPVNSNC